MEALTAAEEGNDKEEERMTMEMESAIDGLAEGAFGK